MPAAKQTGGVVGLDEVGRGAFAGPLAAAAVMLPVDALSLLGDHAPLLRDSKSLNRKQRELMSALIRKLGVIVQTAIISVEYINTHGIGWANQVIFRKLIDGIDAPAYVVDGSIKPTVSSQRASRVVVLPKADATVPAVAAAAIVAKVYRDGLMRDLHKRWPMYGWTRNVGYGTPKHIAAIELHGKSPEHRTAFLQTALTRRARRRQECSTGDYQQEPLSLTDDPGLVSRSACR